MKVLRYQVFDTFQNVFEYTVDDPDVILIDIDEATVKELGQFPFKRDVNARLTNIVGNAKTIAWALLLTSMTFIFLSLPFCLGKILITGFSKYPDSTMPLELLPIIHLHKLIKFK